jgi:uncharacterized protein DUF6152
VKNTPLAFTILTTSLLLGPRPVSGHHGYAAFDPKAEITFAGTVTGFHWTNPHCVVEFDAADDTGKIRTWRGELSSPIHLTPRGWTPTTLESGDKITVTGFRGTNNVPSIWVTKIVLPDGKALPVQLEN